MTWPVDHGDDNDDDDDYDNNGANGDNGHGWVDPQTYQTYLHDYS